MVNKKFVWFCHLVSTLYFLQCLSSITRFLLLKITLFDTVQM